PPQYAPAMALSTVSLGFLLLMVALQRSYISNCSYATVTVCGFLIRRTSLGKGRTPGVLLVLLFSLVVTVLPTILLVAGTFMKLFGFFNIPSPWTLDNGRAPASDPVLLRCMWNTLAIGLGSGLFGIFFYSLIAYVI